METKIPLYRVWENNLIPSTTRLSFRRPPDHGGVLSMSSPSRSHIYNRTQQDSFHGELVWKNHDSRLLMKSRFMRKKIGHSRITKIPFAKLEPPAEPEGIFQFEDLFRRRGKRTPSHPTPTHSVWNILYLFCTSYDTADTSHERNFFQFTWRQNILLQGNGLVFYDTPQGRKIVTIGNEMLICSSKIRSRFRRVLSSSFPLWLI